MEGWTTRSFVSADTQPSATDYINLVNGEIVFTGEDGDGDFTNPPTVGSQSPCECCPNLACYPGSATVECADDSPYYENHACELTNESTATTDAHASVWEGGEMWKSFNTSGYKNLVVIYTIKEVSGLHDKPHGPCRSCGRRQFGEGRSAGVLPYTNCTNLVNRDNCVDHGHTEEMLSVLFTAKMNTSEPYVASGFVSDATSPLGNWEYADILTHKFLKGIGTEGDLRVLEFSMHDETDNLPDGQFGLWFRAQLNSDESGEADKIVIDDILLLGQEAN